VEAVAALAALLTETCWGCPMDKAIEILRRLFQVITWAICGCFVVFFVMAYFSGDTDDGLLYAFCAPLLAVAVSKTVNYIFLKDE